MRRLLPVLHALGAIIVLFALPMLFPWAWSWLANDGVHAVYDDSVLITVGLGSLLWFLTRTRAARRELQPRDGFLLVSLVWTVLPAFATLPLLLHSPHLSFTDAYFEAVSGLTASGATVLSGLDGLPASLNIWRGTLMLLGGMGIIVLAVAVLPLLGVGGSQVFKAETPGPMKDDKLTPRITETAKGLWGIYLALTVACILAYRIAGMTWTDAVMHAFTTMGLGGFSSHDASFAHFNSLAIEVVACVFMALAGINFASHFVFWRTRSLNCYISDPEAVWFIAIVLGSVLMVALFLFVHAVYPSFGTCLRYAAFTVISLATTTGFATADYAQWPIFLPIWLLFLCSFTSCAGSTGGGIKMVRAVLLAKQAMRELTRIIHPRAVVPVKLAGRVIDNQVIFSVLAFMLMYGGTLVAMTMLLTASGLDVITAFTAVIACINNTGPGLGQVGPATTYAVLTDFQTWVCTATMLLGRLELFAILVLFTPGFWRR
jgi:trk system potassium uptake protein TrkH